MSEASIVSTCSPAQAGVDPDRLEALLERARAEVTAGRVEGAQLALARHRQLVAFECYGEADQGGERRPVTTETLFNVFSCTKGVAAAAFWTLLEQQKVSIDQHVADIIPEFATHGKAAITVEQVLTHTGGFPRAFLGSRAWSTSEGRRAAMAEWIPEHPAGEVYEAHAFSGHWVLVEIIETLTGEDFRTYINQSLLRASGIDDFWLGLPDQLHSRVADIVWMGQPPVPPGQWRDAPPEIGVLLFFNTPTARRAGVPGGGGIGTARALAMLYQVLIHGGIGPNGNRILNPDTIEFATKVRTDAHHVDAALTGLPANRALSVAIAGDTPAERRARGYGETSSPRAFGHGGIGGQIAWGDPDSGLSFGYCTNTQVNEPEWRARSAELSSLAAATVT